MKIVIPSHMRADQQILLTRSIPESFKDVYIAVREEQADAYAIHSDRATILPFKGLTGIHDKRDAIARHFAGEKIWMIDDDCILCNTQINDEKGTLGGSAEPFTESDFYEMYNYTKDLLDTYYHGVAAWTVFPRVKKDYPYKLNKWGGGNTFLNLAKIDADLLQYNWLDHSEDLVAYLSVVDAGYDSFNLVKWLFKTVKTGQAGGMTEFRNNHNELITNANIAINKRWPQHTKLGTKKYMSGMKSESLSIRVRVNDSKRTFRNNKIAEFI